MEIYDAIHHRRSHRLYKPDLPPREVLERVIEAALWAPSGVNLQAWELTVMAGQVRDDFVALVSRAVQYLGPRLKQTDLPEAVQDQDGQRVTRGMPCPRDLLSSSSARRDHSRARVV